jgi:Uma2 family endonuclease
VALADASDLIVVPRAAVELPLALPVPDGFDPGAPATWPRVPGRLEYVQGRLLYMPPSGDVQQQTAADAVGALIAWQRRHPAFVVGANEAGMLLGGDVRAADAAVWRREAVVPTTGGLPRLPPVLAVEVAGREDTLGMLRDKARWYLARGVTVVWILLPATRSALVISEAGETPVPPGGRMPAQTDLPDLEPALDDLFRQIGTR